MYSKGKKLFKDFGVILLGSFGSKILSFLMIPLYTSILSTSDYGIIDLINTSVFSNCHFEISFFHHNHQLSDLLLFVYLHICIYNSLPCNSSRLNMHLREAFVQERFGTVNLRLNCIVQNVHRHWNILRIANMYTANWNIY